MHKPLLIIVLLTAIMVLVPAGLIFWDYSDQKWRERTQTGSTQATVISVDSFYHNTACYSYSVKDKTYQAGQPGLGGRFRPGDVIVFHYNPSDPMQGTLGDYEPSIPYSPLLAFPIITIIVLWSYYLFVLKNTRSLLKPSSINYDI